MSHQRSSEEPHINNNTLSLYQKIRISDIVGILRKIELEEEELLKQFNKLAKESKSLSQVYDVMEALNYELSVRNYDKLALLNQIIEGENALIYTFRELEREYNELLTQFQSLSKFHHTRSFRQTGRYIAFKKEGNEQNLTNFEQIDLPNTITCLTYDEQLEEKDLQMIMTQVPQGGQQSTEQFVIDESQVYDWVLDIDLLPNLVQGGWPVYISQKFSDSKEKVGLASNNSQQWSLKKWEGATVAVVGLYDKGKTFVLNNLTQSNLPSGKKVTTKGISFKHVDVDAGTNLILVDTAGSYSPVQIKTNQSIAEKEATELFILDLVFELSDYFICVVNDFTSLDQRYLDRLSRNLQHSAKTFREIIVIHNLKEVESPEILHHVWTTQVTQIYQTGGSVQRTKVAATNPITSQLQEKHVLWFKTQFTRHVCLVCDDSYLGLSVNPWVFSLLKYWLKAVFVPVNRQFSVCDTILSYSRSKLSNYFKNNLSLKLVDTDNELLKKIVQVADKMDPLIKSESQDTMQNTNWRIHQVSIDQSGLIMARPDSFIPATDIIAADQYIIYMDVPGIQEEEIEMYRQNIITMVKGNRKRPYTELMAEQIERQERKYGEFTLSFKIPENYERKWSYFGVENGVLKIVYEKDKDDLVPNKHSQD